MAAVAFVTSQARKLTPILSLWNGPFPLQGKKAVFLTTHVQDRRAMRQNIPHTGKGGSIIMNSGV